MGLYAVRFKIALVENNPTDNAFASRRRAESNKLAKSWMDLCVLTQELSSLSLCQLKYFHLP